jgi:hypothetical protein
MDEPKSILHEANETTLAEVTTFVEGALSTEYTFLYCVKIQSLTWCRERDQIPTGLIVTGPNIASQELLFAQIAEGLKSFIRGPVVILRSGDANNLKSILKKIIRDATNQKEREDNCDDLQVIARNVGSLCILMNSLIENHRVANCSIMTCRFCMITFKLVVRARL